MNTTKTSTRTDFKMVKPGDVFSEQQYYVHQKTVGDKAQFLTDTGEQVVLDKNYVESLLTSANQHFSEQKITRTELAALFLSNPYTAMQVSFNKQVKEADVVKEIMETYATSTPKEFEAKLKKAIKTGLSGEERVITGRHNGQLNDLGRVMFIDMEIPLGEHRERQVDPRNINWVIVKGTKYITK